ncbi:MAG: enoyl-CoA hydratase/isomerase family protein [Thalassovita sp.]
MTQITPIKPTPEDGLCVAQTHGATRLLWLNLPKRRNALSPDLRADLRVQLDAAIADEGIRAIVIAGVQGCFSAGGDISTMKGITSVAGRARMQNAGALMQTIIDSPKPIIAAVEGWCVGAGLSLAAACDIVIAARDAKFSLPFGKLGLIPDLASLYTLPPRIGTGRTKWLAFTRRVIDAEQALDWGLAEELVESDAIPHALALAEEISDGAPLTHAYTKELMARLPLTLPEFLAAERDTQAILYTSEDFAEGYAAFFDKRAPEFTGR